MNLSTPWGHSSFTIKDPDVHKAAEALIDNAYTRQKRVERDHADDVAKTRADLHDVPRLTIPLLIAPLRRGFFFSCSRKLLKFSRNGKSVRYEITGSRLIY